MSNEPGEPTVLWFSDVPNIQYIRAPLAMHVSYWHQDFSNPKSAECVNVWRKTATGCSAGPIRRCPRTGARCGRDPATAAPHRS